MKETDGVTKSNSVTLCKEITLKLQNVFKGALQNSTTHILANAALQCGHALTSPKLDWLLTQLTTKKLKEGEALFEHTERRL